MWVRLLTVKAVSSKQHATLFVYRNLLIVWILLLVVEVFFLLESRFLSQHLVLLCRVEVDILSLSLVVRLVNLEKLGVCIVVSYVMLWVWSRKLWGLDLHFWLLIWMNRVVVWFVFWEGVIRVDLTLNFFTGIWTWKWSESGWCVKLQQLV